jgi:hypothetical protein
MNDTESLCACKPCLESIVAIEVAKPVRRLTAFMRINAYGKCNEIFYS